MAALSRFGSKAPSPVTLGAAFQLGELLAVLWSFAPTAAAAGLVARCAVTLRLVKVVGVEVLGRGPADDLLPFDSLDVAEVVVVDDPDTAFKNI